MLQELYKYALDNDLFISPEYEITDVKWYISFSRSGEFLGIDASINKSICPNIGDLSQGDKSHLIAEKAEILFLLEDKAGKVKANLLKKHRFYTELMNKAAEHDELIKTAINSFEKNYDTIRNAYMSTPNCKYGQFVSMKVDGIALEDSSNYRDWWSSYRRSLYPDTEGGKVRCFITGDLMNRHSEPIPLIKGLGAVGGSGTGCRLYSFYANEHRSYGLFNDSGNVLTSINAMVAVKCALNSLIKESGNLLCGSKDIHWYKDSPEIDVLDALELDLELDLGIEDSEADDDADKKEKNAEDARKIKRMYKYIFDGKSLEKPDNRYYMMSLSGVNGRVMIRSFDEGSYDELYYSITRWYDDLTLISANGKGEGKFPKLFTISTRLLKFSSDRSKLKERIRDELSGLETQIIYSITHNTPLPDTVAARALAYVRSDMYASSQDDSSPRAKQIDRVSCQILKAWLNRKYKDQNKEEYIIMAELNKESPSKAYQTGRLMAVYAKIQNASLGDVNAGVVEKYYTSACTSPALVIGKLATMSHYHLSKLDKGLAFYFSKILEEISEKIGCSLPATFSMTEQAEFALGYYHQNAEMSRKKNDGSVDDNKED